MTKEDRKKNKTRQGKTRQGEARQEKGSDEKNMTREDVLGSSPHVTRFPFHAKTGSFFQVFYEQFFHARF